MKILLIHPFIQLGGGEQVILRLANYFVTKGHTVGIACCFVDKDFVYPIDKKVVLHTPPTFFSTLCKSNRILLALIGMPSLLFLCIQTSFHYDILFPHNFPSIFFAMCARFFSKKEIVWEFNEGLSRLKLLEVLENFSGKFAKKIIVLDEKNKKRVQRRFGKKAYVIRPGVDFIFWSKRATKEKKYEKKFLLLSVGKLHPQKNQILLVHVVKKLLSNIPSIHLVLVGKGPDEKRIKEVIQENGLEKHVNLLGVVSNPHLRILYKTASFVCFPALDQTWGLTPFEALCQKTPCIVSSEAGAGEILFPHSIALKADPTLASFSYTIQKAYKNKKANQTIGHRGFSYVKKHLTWNNFCGSVEEILIKTSRQT